MIARSEFILGGQRSGKSRRAETIARDWLAAAPDHKAVMIATATAWDDEMRERIVRHQQDRAERVPGMHTVEEPVALAQAIAAHSAANTLIVVDCLTLWLTNLLMPVPASQLLDGTSGRCDPNEAGGNVSLFKFIEKSAVAQSGQTHLAMLSGAITSCAGPVVVVGNEIGLGVIPLGRETREFVDALGRLNQDVAAICERVTLMVAGLPLVLKEKEKGREKSRDKREGQP